MPKTPKRKFKRNPYVVHPAYALEETCRTNLQKRTGKTLEQWVEFVKENGPPTEKERREWLKSKHGLTTNYAWWVAQQAEGITGVEDYDPEALVDKLFSGGKAGLRPIFERLMELALDLGEDVTATPCQTIVPLRRKYVFAQIKPSTRTRVDLGLALKDTPITGRLIDTGGRAKGDRLTHRIPITRLEEIDEEVQRWMKAAYDLDV